jgi:hypothetical protein
MVKVLLVTACGCSRRMVVDGDLPPDIFLPLKSRVAYLAGDEVPVEQRARRFRLSSVFDVSGERVYSEVVGC